MRQRGGCARYAQPIIHMYTYMLPYRLAGHRQLCGGGRGCARACAWRKQDETGQGKRRGDEREGFTTSGERIPQPWRRSSTGAVAPRERVRERERESLFIQRRQRGPTGHLSRFCPRHRTGNSAYTVRAAASSVIAHVDSSLTPRVTQTVPLLHSFTSSLNPCSTGILGVSRALVKLPSLLLLLAISTTASPFYTLWKRCSAVVTIERNTHLQQHSSRSDGLSRRRSHNAEYRTQALINVSQQ